MISRTIRRVSVVVVLLLGSGTATAFAQIVKPLYPLGGAPGGNFRVAVLADGYPTGADTQFETDARNLINSDLMVDPFYASVSSHFAFTTVFTPTPAGQASLFGIGIVGSINNCYISTRPDTDTLVEQAVAASVPLALHAIILRNDGSLIACTHKQLWTFVTSGNVNEIGTLEHEFGHLVAGLFDEYVLSGNANAPYPDPPVFGPNCSTSRGLPWWKTFAMTPPPGTVAGCDFYGQAIFRGYDTCRMRSIDQPFCQVCALGMRFWLNALRVLPLLQPPLRRTRTLPVAFVAQPPAAPGPAPNAVGNRSVRVLVTIDRQNGVAHAVSATDVDAPGLQQHRWSGPYVYAIREGDRTLETGAIPGDPFESRAYSGASAPHGSDRSGSASLIVFIPYATKQNLLARNVTIGFYRLRQPPQRPDITPEYFDQLSAADTARRIAIVTADDLKKALQ